MKLIQTQNYLLLIDEEAEININDYWIYLNSNEGFDGVVTKSNLTEKYWYGKLHDRFAYKKVTAHYPLNSEAKELELPLLPNPFEIDVEVIIKDCFGTNDNSKILLNELTHDDLRTLARNGYNHGQVKSKQFSLEDVEYAITQAFLKGIDRVEFNETIKEQIIQSLFTQQLPKEFIPEYEREHDDTVPFPKMRDSKTIKTITNLEGKEELVGTYK